MNYPDSVQFLYSLGNEIKTAKFGLDRILAVLDALGNPHRRCAFIHVAGTNGKGSTCAMLESGLRAAGRRTGLYTSPHLYEPTERIRLDGVPVTAERFTAAFDRVHRAVEELLASGAIDLHTTYFETVTAMAFLIFAEQEADEVVLEVGLGGRLDATNVVTPRLAVITPVDFDHEKFLGTSLVSIAGEKAGILKPGVSAVFARQRAEAGVVLDARAAELGIAVTRTRDWSVTGLELSPRGSRFHLFGERQMDVVCPLAGAHQVENAVTAAVALAHLGIATHAIESGIARAQWPGRLELAGAHPDIVLDGAHNPAGARALAAYIERFYAGRRITLVFGVMRDKSVEEIAATLFPLAADVIVTAPAQTRALSPAAVPSLVGHPSLRVEPSLEQALAAARATQPDAIFVTGSLFLVAEARAMIGAKT